MPNTYCVSKTDLIAAHVKKFLSYLIDCCQVYFSLIRTTHNTRYITSNFYFILFRHVHYHLESSKTFLDCTIYILVCKSLTSCSKYCNLLNTSIQRKLHTFGVRHKYWITYTRKFFDLFENLSTVC